MGTIEIENLQISYQVDGLERPVLSGVDLSCRPGDMIAILGRSGAGKSTLFHIIGCLLRASKGRVRINGIDTSQISEEQIATLRNRTIGFIFQQFFLMPKLTVLENILLPTQFSPHVDPTSRRRAELLATRLRIRSELAKYPNQLSGGQQQRVAIARALINNPEIILADEPTGALDVETASEIVGLLEEVADSGKIVIAITHDPKVAERFRQVYRLEDGKLCKTLSRPSGAAPLGSVDTARTAEPMYSPFQHGFRQLRGVFRLAFENLSRNRLRTILSITGIFVGVASVEASISFSRYLRESIVGSFSQMGTRVVKVKLTPKKRNLSKWSYLEEFRGPNLQRDFEAARNFFPGIVGASFTSPISHVTLSYGSRSETVLTVASDEFFTSVTSQKFIMGQGFHSLHVERRFPVCIIGAETKRAIFGSEMPLEKHVVLTRDKVALSCRVVGVTEHVGGGANEYFNKSVFIPYTIADSIRDSSVLETSFVLFRLSDESRIGEVRLLTDFWNRIYGDTVVTRLISESQILKQMGLVMTAVTIITASIAGLTLLGGGVGVNNMIQMTISERVREIGLALALGASGRTIQIQVLLESFLLCHVAGVLGVIVGFLGFEIALYLASQMTNKIQFAWVIDPWAIGISLFAMLLVGILSGLAPARKARQIQVIDALRVN